MNTEYSAIITPYMENHSLILLVLAPLGSLLGSIDRGLQAAGPVRQVWCHDGAELLQLGTARPSRRYPIKDGTREKYSCLNAWIYYV